MFEFDDQKFIAIDRETGAYLESWGGERIDVFQRSFGLHVDDMIIPLSAMECIRFHGDNRVKPIPMRSATSEEIELAEKHFWWLMSFGMALNKPYELKDVSFDTTTQLRKYLEIAKKALQEYGNGLRKYYKRYDETEVAFHY